MADYKKKPYKINQKRIKLRDKWAKENQYDLKTLIGPIDAQDVATQKHYTQFEIQPIEFIERNKLGWCAGNVVKYVCREGKKNGLEDLLKASTYLDCLIHQKKTGIFLPPDKLRYEIAVGNLS